MHRQTNSNTVMSEKDSLNPMYYREFVLPSIGMLFNLIFLVIICQNLKTKSLNSRKPMGFLLIGFFEL